MPESVWDNIYKGIKDFAGDENKANALIGGGIGAGIGGLIDGWRGAGIGALGGGIAGYKSNDIKKWWNTPTEKIKYMPYKPIPTKTTREWAEEIFTKLNEKQKQKLQDQLRNYKGLDVYDLLSRDINFYNEDLSKEIKQTLKNVFNINNAQDFIDYEKKWSHSKKPNFRAHVITLSERPYNSLAKLEKQYMRDEYNITDEKSYSDYILENVDDGKVKDFVLDAWFKQPRRK